MTSYGEELAKALGYETDTGCVPSTYWPQVTPEVAEQPGYKLLAVGEYCAPGDEYLQASNPPDWQQVGTLSIRIDPPNCLVRRRLDQTTAVASSELWCCTNAQPHKRMQNEARCPVCWALFGQSITVSRKV